MIFVKGETKTINKSHLKAKGFGSKSFIDFTGMQLITKTQFIIDCHSTIMMFSNTYAITMQ